MCLMIKCLEHQNVLHQKLNIWTLFNSIYTVLQFFHGNFWMPHQGLIFWQPSKRQPFSIIYHTYSNRYLNSCVAIWANYLNFKGKLLKWKMLKAKTLEHGRTCMQLWGNLDGQQHCMMGSNFGQELHCYKFKCSGFLDLLHKFQ